jgi:uracil-DNA glycosylase family 4
MILGEAPGRSEDELNRPFVGASGKLLRSTLLEAGLPLKKCYITNTVKCFPDGTPDKKQTAICARNYLYKEMEVLEPRYILTLGKTAFKSISFGLEFNEARGCVNSSSLGDALLFPIWHPAYILRNRSKEKEWKIDIQNFKALVEVDYGVL